MFKLDRNTFSKQSFREADCHLDIENKLSTNERLKISFYLNSIAYQFDTNHPPKMDKTVFKRRRRNE